jgi:hypothetical protein
MDRSSLSFCQLEQRLDGIEQKLTKEKLSVCVYFVFESNSNISNSTLML